MTIVYLTLHKISKFHLISWYGNLFENAQFPTVACIYHENFHCFINFVEKLFPKTAFRKQQNYM